MKTILILLALTAFISATNYGTVKFIETEPKYTLLFKSPYGIEVTYKEKYGIEKTDTCTIIMGNKYEYLLIKRDLSKISVTKVNTNSFKWMGIK